MGDGINEAPPLRVREDLADEPTESEETEDDGLRRPEPEAGESESL